jgi:hypothetical protein
MSVGELENKYGFSFKEYFEDGLGTCYAAIININGNLYFARGHFDKDCKNPCVCFHMQGNNPDPDSSVNDICKALGIDRQDAPWVTDQLDKPNYSVLRQGDDGNEVQMFRVHEKYIADHVVKKYTDRGHKQIYFVRKLF